MTKYERAALRDVNRIRRAEGRKPLARLPKGKVEEGYECPLANALGRGKVCVGHGPALIVPAAKLAAYMAAGLKLGDTTVALRLPKSFVKFIAWFDAQKTREAQELNEDFVEEEEEAGAP